MADGLMAGNISLFTEMAGNFFLSTFPTNRIWQRYVCIYVKGEGGPVRRDEMYEPKEVGGAWGL